MTVMVLKPHLSEKAYAQSKTENTYSLNVPKSANKQSVLESIKAQYKVTPISVNITNIKGKKKRSNLKGGKSVYGKRVDVKKAYVTLKKGDVLPFFDAIEKEEEEAAKTEEKVQAAVEKSAKKESAKAEPKKRSIRQAFSKTPRKTQNRGGDK